MCARAHARVYIPATGILNVIVMCTFVRFSLSLSLSCARAHGRMYSHCNSHTLTQARTHAHTQTNISYLHTYSLQVLLLVDELCCEMSV